MSLLGTTISISATGGESVSFGAVTQNVNLTDANAVTGLTTGTGVLQAQRIQKVTLAPATSAGTTYDLTALPGGLDGASRNYTGIKWIKIENLDPTNAVTIQGGAANGWVGINGITTANPITLNPGDCFVRFAPNTAIAVGASNKTILMIAAAGSPNVAVSLIGLGT